MDMNTFLDETKMNKPVVDKHGVLNLLKCIDYIQAKESMFDKDKFWRWLTDYGIVKSNDTKIFLPVDVVGNYDISQMLYIFKRHFSLGSSQTYLVTW